VGGSDSFFLPIKTSGPATQRTSIVFVPVTQTTIILPIPIQPGQERVVNIYTYLMGVSQGRMSVRVRMPEHLQV